MPPGVRNSPGGRFCEIKIDNTLAWTIQPPPHPPPPQSCGGTRPTPSTGHVVKRPQSRAADNDKCPTPVAKSS